MKRFNFKDYTAYRNYIKRRGRALSMGQEVINKNLKTYNAINHELSKGLYGYILYSLYGYGVTIEDVRRLSPHQDTMRDIAKAIIRGDIKASDEAVRGLREALSNEN